MNDKFSIPKGDITIRMAEPQDAALVRSLRLEALSCIQRRSPQTWR